MSWCRIWADLQGSPEEGFRFCVPLLEATDLAEESERLILVGIAAEYGPDGRFGAFKVTASELGSSIR
jgi:hypothetical protein